MVWRRGYFPGCLAAFGHFLSITGPATKIAAAVGGLSDPLPSHRAGLGTWEPNHPNPQRPDLFERLWNRRLRLKLYQGWPRSLGRQVLMEASDDNAWRSS
jgi:hypothetical protein